MQRVQLTQQILLAIGPSLVADLLGIPAPIFQGAWAINLGKIVGSSICTYIFSLESSLTSLCKETTNNGHILFGYLDPSSYALTGDLVWAMRLASWPLVWLLGDFFDKKLCGKKCVADWPLDLL